MSEEGVKERADLVSTFAHLGVGKSVAQEIAIDCYHASTPAYKPVSQEAGMAELKALWGDRYDAQIAAAQALIRKAAEKNPSVIEFLNRTKLGNDPKFIRKAAARAAAEARKGRR